MEQQKKTVKRTKKVREYALKDGDWYTLGKILNAQDKRWAGICEDHIPIIFDNLIVNQMLLCDMYEAMGKNPINYCRTLKYYYVYVHGSLESDLPGLRIEDGKVYDADGKEIPYPEMYAAREQGKTFNEALNEQYARDVAENGGDDDEDDGSLTEKNDGEAGEESVLQ